MSTVVGKLGLCSLLVAGSCSSGSEPTLHSQDRGPAQAADGGDTVGTWGDVADANVPARPADAAATLDGMLSGSTDDPRDAGAPPWRRPLVEYPESDAGDVRKLSEFGLYRDIVSKELAPDLIEYEPRYALWSDGAHKRRWLLLPEGTNIETSDPDHWLFPEGTVLFKEFADEQGKRLETRMLARTGPASSDVFLGSFVWLEDESDAVYAPHGENDVRGTEHDVPTQDNCATCHRGEPGRVLGFSAVQRPRVMNASFVVPGVSYDIPGDPRARAALGYLHANCAHCHNDDGTARRDTALVMRLSVHDLTPGQTTIERNLVGVMTDHFSADTGPTGLRVSPGDPAASVILQRMRVRQKTKQMPVLGTEKVDETGVETIESWVASLSADAGVLSRE
jgi:hypothetical protein